MGYDAQSNRRTEKQPKNRRSGKPENNRRTEDRVNRRTVLYPMQAKAACMGHPKSNRRTDDRGNRRTVLDPMQATAACMGNPELVRGKSMGLVWLVTCKTCLQRFPILPRESVAGKSTDALQPNPNVGSFECPHCHEVDHYGTTDFIPGEGKIR